MSSSKKTRPSSSTPTTTTTTFVETSAVVLVVVFAVLCAFAFDLSRGWFAGINFFILAFHAYFLANAIATVDADARKKGTFYSVTSLVALLASAIVKFGYWSRGEE